MTITKVGSAAHYGEDDGTTKKHKKSANQDQSSQSSGSGAILGAAAAGLAVGLAANLGRKAVVQGVTAAAGSWDEALATEHKMALKIFDAMQATDNKSKAKRATLLMSLKHALTKHAVQEENVIYPALRDIGKVEGADQLNHEHGYVKQRLYNLDKMPKDSPEFLVELAKFRTEIEAHMREEEDDLYPKMKAQLDDATNKKLTLMMNKEGFKVA